MIMITENRWLHILGVARQAKRLAEKMRPNDVLFAEDMFLVMNLPKTEKVMPLQARKYLNGRDIKTGRSLRNTAIPKSKKCLTLCLF